jgi:hypothetical protein
LPCLFLQQVGTIEKPFPRKVVITLHGRPPGSPELPVVITPELPIYGAKNIAVRLGTLDLHGLPKLPTWTRLAATARAGATTIELSQPVNWLVDDEIVIASSGYLPVEAEKVTVTTVSNEGKTITFSPALQYVHYGELQTFNGEIVDTRAEVIINTNTHV